MTRFYFTLCFAFSFLFLNAQIQEGTVALGGNILARQNNADPSFESFTFSISPAFGYFINDNFGLIGGFSHSALDNTVDNYPAENQTREFTASATNIFLGARHYFNLLDYRFFGQLDLINQKSENLLVNQLSADNVEILRRSDVNIFNSKISIGANAYLSDNIVIEGILKYSFLKNRSYEDRLRVLKGPIEFIADIRPYISTGFGDAASNSEEFLAQGTWNIGGTAGMSHSLRDNQRRFSDSLILNNQELELWLQPKFGYFFFDNFLIGMDGGLSYVDNVTNNPISLAAAPYIRYYIRATPGLQVVPNFTMVYNYVQNRLEFSGTESVDESFQFISGIGLHSFIAENVGLFANGVVNIKLRPDATGTELNPKKFTGVQFQVGLEYYISDF